MQQQDIETKNSYRFDDLKKEANMLETKRFLLKEEFKKMVKEHKEEKEKSEKARKRNDEYIRKKKDVER